MKARRVVCMERIRLTSVALVCSVCSECIHVTRMTQRIAHTGRRNYYVFLVCPSCHRSKWLLLTRPKVSRNDLLNTFWTFECPIHGSLYEKPLQVAEKFAPFLPTADEQ